MLIKNGTGYIQNVGGVQLVPGTNQLDDKQAEAFNAAIKANTLDAFLFGEGLLTIVSTENGNEANDITDMTVDKATELIGNTASVETLTNWLADEKRSGNRKSMVDLINARLAELTPATDKKQREAARWMTQIRAPSQMFA